MKTCKGFLEFYLNGALIAKYAEKSMKGFRIVEIDSREHGSLDFTHGILS